MLKHLSFDAAMVQLTHFQCEITLCTKSAATTATTHREQIECTHRTIAALYLLFQFFFSVCYCDARFFIIIYVFKWKLNTFAIYRY